MQEGSEELEAALARSSVIWKPGVLVDWDSDGYGGVSTIDDLSNQADSITVVQSMDDGMPDEVTLLSGSGIPAGSAQLSGRAGADGVTPLTSTQYWSPFNPNSPLYGYDRDVAPAKIEQSALTDEGFQAIRLFTGRIADTPVAAGRATLQVVSQTRQDMSRLVLPNQAMTRDPVGDGYIYGLTATWPIVQALHDCEVYPSPPAHDVETNELSLWAPLHGGGTPFWPLFSVNFLSAQFYGFRVGEAFPTHNTSITGSDFPSAAFHKPQWVRGPFVGAALGKITDTYVRGVNLSYSNGPWKWNQVTNRCRIEFWIRGDEFDAAGAPAGEDGFDLSGMGINYVAGIGQVQDDGGNGYAIAGIGTDRVLFIAVSDGTTATLITGPTLPADGLWHFCGFAVNGAGGDAWINLDGAVTTDTFTINTSLLSATASTDGFGQITFCLPAAEVQCLIGAVSDPDTGEPWLLDMDWERRAYVYPSPLDLEVSADEAPTETWQLLAAYSQSDLSTMHIDEHDLFHYRPRGWYATEEGQTIAQTLTTAHDAAIPDVVLDVSRVRNACRVTYNQTFVADTRSALFELRTIVGIPPGTSTMTIALSTPGFGILTGTLSRLSAPPAENTTNWFTANTQPDGSGVYASDSTTITATISTTDDTAFNAGQVVVTFTNNTPSTWYLVNNTAAPYLVISGYVISKASGYADTFSVAAVLLRGYRSLTVNPDRIQTLERASHMARSLVLLQRNPIPIIGQQEIFGDPRRQVGDLLLVEDPVETGLSERFRLHSIRHSATGGGYTQVIQAQKNRQVGTWTIPTISNDSFDRTETDTWGSNNGLAYTTSGGASSDYDVAGGAATMLLTSVSVDRQATIGSGIKNIDQVVYFQTALASGDFYYVRVLARYVDASNYLRVSFDAGTNGFIDLDISQIVGGVVAQLNFANNYVAYSADDIIAARVQVTGDAGRTRVKIWNVTDAGDTQPDDWDLEYLFGISDDLADGAAGLQARREAANTNSDLIVPFYSYWVRGDGGSSTASLWGREIWAGQEAELA